MIHKCSFSSQLSQVTQKASIKFEWTLLIRGGIHVENIPPTNLVDLLTMLQFSSIMLKQVPANGALIVSHREEEKYIRFHITSKVLHLS